MRPPHEGIGKPEALSGNLAGYARTDLLAILDFISDDNPDAAQRLKDEIEACRFDWLALIRPGGHLLPPGEGSGLTRIGEASFVRRV